MSNSVPQKWWTQEDRSAFNDLFNIVNYIIKNQSNRSATNIRYARLYQNLELLGFSIGSYSKLNTTAWRNNRLTLNVVKSCIDTAASKIAKASPKPLFLTEDGDFTLKRKSKLLTQYVAGIFEQLNIYEIGQKVFVDCAVFGTGCLKIYIDDENIKAERVLIDEIIVDDAEGMYADPQTIYQRKYYQKDALIAMFPEHELKIKTASVALRSDVVSSIQADSVVVLESWHLPSSNEKDEDGKLKYPGKHIIAIDNCTLVLEDYEKNYFPFVFLRWTDKIQGFWGSGIAEELIGIQLEINKTLKNVQMSQNVMSVPRIAIENGSDIASTIITNEIGSFIKYTGTPPQAINWSGQTQEIYSWIENLYNKAFEITGVSRLSAQSAKPAGLNSGAALREYQDIESERFQLVGKRYEKMYMDIARLIVDFSKDLYDQNPKLTVTTKTNKFLKKIKWSDIDLKNDQFILDVYPTNILPSTPAGKLQTIQELIQAGMIPQDQALALLDFPDLERFISLKTSSQDNIERILEIITTEGRYISPEPYQDLNLSIKLTQETYLRAKCDNLSEDKLELLQNYMDDCKTLLSQAAPPPAAQIQENNNAQMGTPMPAPQSDLLPRQ